MMVPMEEGGEHDEAAPEGEVHMTLNESREQCESFTPSGDIRA